MNASTTYTQSLPSSILGAEPYPLTTFSLDIPAGGGVLKAGTLITRAGGKAVTAATTHGVLAFDTDATLATSAVVYLTGSFLRDLVVAANTPTVIDDAFEDGLRAKGIYFERSIGT